MLTSRRYPVLNFIAILLLSACAVKPAPVPDVVAYHQLINWDAAKIARILNESLPLTATSDARTNTVKLKGPPEIVQAVSGLLGKIENSPYEIVGDPTITFITPLKHAKATDIAARLNSMPKVEFFPTYPSTWGNPMIILSYEPSNLLFIATPESAELKIRQAIAELDQPVKSN